MTEKKHLKIKFVLKKVEEIYWKQYSKNKQLQLHLEIIYVTGWKDDPSQQKSLKPGEGEISLKNVLK